MPGLDPDPGPVARLEAVKRDVNVPSVVFQRVVDGARLKDIARAWGVPVGRFVEWFTTEHAGLYERALAIQADEDARDAVEIADGASEDDVAPRKLRADVRRWRASKWDRARYGDQVQVQHGGRAVLRVEFGTPVARAERLIESSEAAEDTDPE